MISTYKRNLLFRKTSTHIDLTFIRYEPKTLVMYLKAIRTIRWNVDQSKNVRGKCNFRGFIIEVSIHQGCQTFGWNKFDLTRSRCVLRTCFNNHCLPLQRALLLVINLGSYYSTKCVFNMQIPLKRLVIKLSARTSAPN